MITTDSHDRWIVGGLLVVGLSLTTWASVFFLQQGELNNQTELAFMAHEIKVNIQERLTASAQILRSSAALFDTLDTVSRDSWRTFVARLEVDKNLPGIQGVGFSRWDPTTLTSSIIYLEPSTGRNLRAFGYDMFSEPVRRVAMERARDENVPALSGKVTLIQETNMDVQSGTLLYFPVYKEGLKGWVYSAFRMNDFICGTLRNWETREKSHTLEFQLYDGLVEDPKALLFASKLLANQDLFIPLTRIQQISILFGGHQWTLKMIEKLAIEQFGLVAGVTLGGLCITLLLAGLVFLLRQKSEKVYRNLADRYQTLLETSSSGIHVISENGRLHEFNQAFCAMLGYSYQEAQELSVWDWDFQWSKEELVERTRSLLTKSEVFSTRWRRKDGTHLDVEVHGTGIRLEGRDHLFASARDVTDSLAADSKLKQSEDRLRVVFETLSEGIALNEMVFNAAGEAVDYRILEVNKSFYLQADYQKGVSVVGALATDLYGMDADYISQFWRRHSLIETTVRVEYTSSLSHQTFLISTSPFQDHRFVTSFYDITELKQVEKEVADQNAKAQLVLKSESLGRMTAAIAHHFNNQLQTVIGNLELMGRLPGATTLTKYLILARKASDRAADMSRLMLTSLGQATLERSTVPLSSLVGPQRAVVILELNLPDPQPCVLVDLGRLRQVVDQMVTNAQESLGEGGGPVTIDVSVVAGDLIPSMHRLPLGWVSQDPHYASISVIDSGLGVPETDLDKLFDPFFTTKTVGRGLGLPVALGIVQAHGGAMTVENRKGRGLQIRCFLPLVIPGPTTREKQSVLVIDDDDLLLGVLKELVQSLDYPVLSAPDGAQGLEMFVKHRSEICCVITDLNMPGMDGWQVLRELRRIGGSLRRGATKVSSPKDT